MMKGNAQTRAEMILIHYFERAGVKLDNDCRAEIRGIVEDIIQAAVERSKES